MNIFLRPQIRYTTLRDYGAFQIHAPIAAMREDNSRKQGQWRGVPGNITQSYSARGGIQLHATQNQGVAVNVAAGVHPYYSYAPPVIFYPNRGTPLQSSWPSVSGGTIQLPTQNGPNTPVPLFLHDGVRKKASFPTVTKQVYKQKEKQKKAVTARPKPAQKRWISFIIRTILTVILFAMLFKSFSWSSVLATLTHAHRGVLLIALVVGAGGVVACAYQWHSLLQAERIRFDLAKLVNLHIVSIACNHFLPTEMGGDTIKALRVGRESGNSAGAEGAVVMCRITSFFGMLLVAIPALIFWRTHFPPEFVVCFTSLSALMGGIIGVAFLFVTLVPKVFGGRWMQHHIFNFITRIGSTLNVGLKRPRSMLVATLYGIVFWILTILNCYCYANALGVKAPFYFYIVVVPLISLITFLPITINGFGLRESAFVYVFSTIHIVAATALLLALLIDVQALLFGYTGGCIYFTMGYSNNSVDQTSRRRLRV